MSVIELFDTTSWHNSLSADDQQRAVKAIENGKVLYFPNLSFCLDEAETFLLDPQILMKGAKNISYDHRHQQLKGAICQADAAHSLQKLMHRFFNFSQQLVDHVLPYYHSNTHFARTSFRPAEIEGRVTSYKKDDTRPHVDAFPATPNQGTRILRVFSNVNPVGKPRIWRVGEPFEAVAKRFLPQIKKPFPGARWALHKLGLTKSYRTLYDHYMLQMHDKMKADLTYQKTANQEKIEFATGSTWMVMTDHVSHAAMSGQHLLEQTIHLPIAGMKYPELSPFRIVERLTSPQ
jgi:hypothetical protein